MYIYIHIYCIHTCVYTYIKHIDIALHTITHTVYIYDYIHTVHVNNINHSPAGLCNSYQFAFFCWDERSSFGLWEVAKRLTPSKMWCFEMEKKGGNSPGNSMFFQHRDDCRGSGWWHRAIEGANGCVLCTKWPAAGGRYGADDWLGPGWMGIQSLGILIQYGKHNKNQPCFWTLLVWTRHFLYFSGLSMSNVPPWTRSNCFIASSLLICAGQPPCVAMPWLAATGAFSMGPWGGHMIWGLRSVGFYCWISVIYQWYQAELFDFVTSYLFHLISPFPAELCTEPFWGCGLYRMFSGLRPAVL